MIKGYTGFVGQAIIALKACEIASEHLRGYEILVYSASIRTRARALKLRLKHKIRVTILSKRTSHHEMLQHFSEARIYIGISLSDGISTSLLEAMATGCFPIQTNTSCANEWLTPNSGSILSASSIESITSALIRAIKSDDIVDQAAILNFNTCNSKATNSVISSIAKGFY
jgi:glycosyltransferase involved in cell wall biosynthesis